MDDLVSTRESSSHSGQQPAQAAAAAPAAHFAGSSSDGADSVRLYAAGSLRAVMTELGELFAKRDEGTPVKGEFGASGIMRLRIEKGEPAEVFASADMGHPQALSQAGRSTWRRSKRSPAAPQTGLSK